LFLCYISLFSPSPDERGPGSEVDTFPLLFPNFQHKNY
jgi:hypothetical protein